MYATLEPELLRSFVAIAETGSFTAAAQRVHRTQSAVSMQIKRLEDTIGCVLFDRDSRTVRLTRDGEVLLGHARRILSAHRDALAAFDREALSGEVVLGAPDDYASTFLPYILARFAETHARVHVNLVCAPSVELLRMAAEHKVDLALVTEGSGEQGARPLHREPLVWVTAVGHHAHEQEPVPLALFQAGCIIRSHATNAMNAAGRSFRIAYTSPSLAGIYTALRTGLAVSVLLRGIIPPGVRELGEAEGFPPLPDIGLLLQRASGANSPVVDRLEAAIVDHFRWGSGLSLAA